MWTDVKEVLPPCAGSDVSKLVKSCVILPSIGEKRNSPFPELESVKANTALPGRVTPECTLDDGYYTWPATRITR